MRELTPDELTWTCDPALLGFGDTAEVQAPPGTIGQERALAALDLGLNIDGDGYNIFVMGIPGTGRSSLTREFADETAAAMPAPSDWCYVYNFRDPRRPRALSIPAGRADGLRRDMDQFVDDLRRDITRVFESDEYAGQRDTTIRAYRDDRSRELEEFEKEARESGFAVGRTPSGIMLAPTLGGEVVTPQQFAGLPEAQRAEIEARRQALERKLEELMRRGHRSERDARRDVQDLDRRVVGDAVRVIIEELSEKYQDAPAVLEYLQQVALDVTDNAEVFRQVAMGEEDQQMQLPAPLQPKPPYERYRVNVLTRSDSDRGAPVVFEVDPTVQNLTGRIEYQAQMGALVTDFTMIQAGALHRANGGFLIIDALNLLTRPFAWDALKRCLQDRCVRIESLAEHLGLISTVNLQPEPVPLDAKIILIGAPYIYSILFSYDPDFPRLFRVKADVDWLNPRSDDMVRAYGAFIADHCRRKNLPAFSAGAVARVVEESVRRAEDREKMTAQFSLVENTVREAAFWARRAGHELVAAEDVDAALRHKIWRSNSLEERLVEYIRRGVLRIETSGAAVGQINGIALIPLGDFIVGRPSRITARSFLGGPTGVVNIEREVKLSGPIHDKGTLIIAGFLGHRYAQDTPISCTITLTFEQSYEEVEGDSASSSELYAILSTLSGLPLRQDLAVTGSVDQNGNIQPIGGVNRKIEGFFAVCKEVGLSDTQGVVIPDSNVDNLMLNSEVIDAVRAGQFHIYSVRTIDEGIALFTGAPAGDLGPDGLYPEGSVNRLVHDRLLAMAEMRRHFAHEDEEREYAPEEAPSKPAEPPRPGLPVPEGDEK